MEPQATEDHDLVAESLAGNQASFQLLVERYQSRLFALARHYTKNAVEIEDLVQDSFLKAYTRLETFQHQSSFYTWLYRIAVNTILDSMKRRGRSPVQAVEDVEVIDAPSHNARIGSPDARMQQAETARVTHEVLATLPDIFRTVLVMREFDGLAYQDIADILGISIGTVESRLFRARAKFKDKLLEKYPDFGEA